MGQSEDIIGVPTVVKEEKLGNEGLLKPNKKSGYHGLYRILFSNLCTCFTEHSCVGSAPYI